VYFFKANTIVAKHNIFHRYGLELKHFKNEFNETVIYYKVNYGSGTGVWWNQFNFYLYDNKKLLPALSEIENINLEFPWSIRPYRIKSTILNTKPLQLKFVYKNQFIDRLGKKIDFIKDSVSIKYTLNSNRKIYKPLFRNNQMSKNKLLSYFLTKNELLFINTNYRLFKNEIYG